MSKAGASCRALFPLPDPRRTSSRVDERGAGRGAGTRARGAARRPRLILVDHLPAQEAGGRQAGGGKGGRGRPVKQGSRAMRPMPPHRRMRLLVQPDPSKQAHFWPVGVGRVPVAPVAPTVSLGPSKPVTGGVGGGDVGAGAGGEVPAGHGVLGGRAGAASVGPAAHRGPGRRQTILAHTRAVTVRDGGAGRPGLLTQVQRPAVEGDVAAAEGREKGNGEERRGQQRGSAWDGHSCTLPLPCSSVGSSKAGCSQGKLTACCWVPRQR